MPTAHGVLLQVDHIDLFTNKRSTRAKKQTSSKSSSQKLQGLVLQPQVTCTAAGNEMAAHYLQLLNAINHL